VQVASRIEDAPSGGEIAYCEYGFGPHSPWGLVSSGKHQSMGMDSGWFKTFLDAFLGSRASIELPIWRVFGEEPDGKRIPVTDEGAWEATWSRISDLRSRDPSKRYHCDHSVDYGLTSARPPGSQE
jgi:hypothetical protein